MKTNKGFIGIGLILAIVLGIVVVGGGAYYLGTKNSSVPKTTEENNNLAKNDSKVDLNIDSILKSNIESFLVSGPYKAVNKDDKVTCKIILYGYENNFAYTFSSCNEFDSNSKLVTGGSFPARFKYDSSYKIVSYNEAADGEGYRDSVKKLFPAKFWDLIISPDISTKEESSNETFSHQPGTIKSIKSDGTNKWILVVDLLTYNPNWGPGTDIGGGFFINQNTKIRNLNITSSTKIQNCTTQYSGYASGFENNLSSFITYANYAIKNGSGEFGYTTYFDISGSNITAIYEQCLP